MARKATAQDVADLAGVSRSAVSLVLNGHGDGNIAPAKQEAILDAARQLNYTPNAVALSLRSQRSRSIGVLIWGGPELSTWRMLHAALRTSAQFGHQLLIMDIGDDHGGAGWAIDTLRDRQVDGFLIVAPTPQTYHPPEILNAIPSVLVNCIDPGRHLASVTAHSADAEALAAVGDQAVRVLLDEIAASRVSSRTVVVAQAFDEE